LIVQPRKRKWEHAREAHLDCARQSLPYFPPRTIIVALSALVLLPTTRRYELGFSNLPTMNFSATRH
jgi:hypothetical protein